MKLNLGSGRTTVAGYINVDIDSTCRPHVVADIRSLPFADGSIEGIQANAVLEHFGRREIDPLLAEWHRVLKPGAPLSVCVPNICAICKLYLSRLPTMSSYFPHDTVDTNYWLFGGQNSPWDYHKIGFDADYLASFLKRNGFKIVRMYQTSQLCVEAVATPIMPQRPLPEPCYSYHLLPTMKRLEARFYALGLTWEYLGDEARARRYFQKVLAINPHNEWASAKLAQAFKPSLPSVVLCRVVASLWEAYDFLRKLVRRSPRLKQLAISLLSLRRGRV